MANGLILTWVVSVDLSLLNSSLRALQTMEVCCPSLIEAEGVTVNLLQDITVTLETKVIIIIHCF